MRNRVRAHIHISKAGINELKVKIKLINSLLFF